MNWMLKLKIKLEVLGSSHFCRLFWSSVFLTLCQSSIFTVYMNPRIQNIHC